MIEALAFIAAASATVAVWLALCRRPVDPAEAGRVLSARAKAARKAERSEWLPRTLPRCWPTLNAKKRAALPTPALNFYTTPKGETDMNDIMNRAADALAELDRAEAAARAAKACVEALCREYGETVRV